jgi:hypothetical protein
MAKHAARQNDVGAASAAARKAQNAAGERAPQGKAALPKNSAAEPVSLGREAWERLRTGRDWGDWKLVGNAFLVGRQWGDGGSQDQ